MFVIIISGILTTLLFFPKSGTVVANSSNSNATRKLYEDGSYVYTAFDSASWAITSNILSPILGTDKQSLYDDYIVQCNEAISKKNEDEGTTTDSNVCNINDEYRQKMNAYQPKSVFNYTKGGYTKTRVPSDLFDLIKEFFNKNRHLAEIEWKQYNVYHNAWSVPPTIVRLQKEKILINQIQEQVKPILEEWTGMHLSPVSTYGIRMYHNGSILAPHVDRMPLVASVIIQVDQDVDTPWPLEVYGHDGKATNITMEPGDMVLYESHSVIHGRPFPMIGNFFANCFIHFEPYAPLDGEAHDPNSDIPPYIVKDSLWEKEWKTDNPDGWKFKKNDDNLNSLIEYGNMIKVQAMFRDNPELVHKKDENGWTCIHEASRSGHLEIVKLILKRGVDKDLLTKTGVTPLNIARQYLEVNHKLIEFLNDIGAKDISPSYNHEL